jgi:predicted nucleotidyltransferase
MAPIGEPGAARPDDERLTRLAVGEFSKLRQRWRDERPARLKRSAGLRQRLAERGLPVLRRYGARRVWLFGSDADGRAGTESAIDLLAIPIENVSYWVVRHELEEALDHPVGLCTQDDDARLVRKMMERGELIDDLQP